MGYPYDEHACLVQAGSESARSEYVATQNMTGADFETTVADNPIVLVDFWAAWCGPCRAFAPTFEAASAKHGEIVFGKVDTESEKDLAQAARIRSIPTLMAFRDGILVYSQPGALRAADLDRLIDQVQGLDMDAVRTKLANQQSADV
jgi:thioredoxin 1